MELTVWLGNRRVGQLSVRAPQDAISFSLVEEYKQSYPRQVLGQIFEDDPDAVHRSNVRLPPFFSNLLPERRGALRALLAEQVGVNADREPFLLAQLGADLPGAVRVTVDDTLNLDDQEMAETLEIAPDALKFSLAGIQLKFSALQASGRFTLPASGIGGDWIVKLPDQQFARVPANEWSMLRWATEVGIEVPQIDLIKVSSIAGVPAEFHELPEQEALAIRRFDREPNGVRVHIEDFAQIRNVYPDRKYRDANYETIGRIIRAVADDESYEEFLRRLVFNVAIGNGDAHLKNWSMIYRDGLRASLAPAYDLVATVLYMADDELALNLAKSKRFVDVSLASFQRLAEKSEFDTKRAEEIVRETVAKVRSDWRLLAPDLHLTDEDKKRLEGRWREIPLMTI